MITVAEKQKLKVFMVVLAGVALFINSRFYSRETSSPVYMPPKPHVTANITTYRTVVEPQAKTSITTNQNVNPNTFQDTNADHQQATPKTDVVEIAGFQPWPDDWRPTQYFSPTGYVTNVLYTKFLIKPTDVICCEIPRGCRYRSEFISRLELMEGNERLGRQCISGSKFPSELARPVYLRIRLKKRERERIVHMQLIRERK